MLFLVLSLLNYYEDGDICKECYVCDFNRNELQKIQELNS